jgi:Lamin Tail Domain
MVSIKALAVLTLVLGVVVTAPAQVLINEVDADTAGTDVLEFVEFYNTGGASVDLGAGGYVVVGYNGSDDLSYDTFTYDLTGTIAAGGFYTVGNPGMGADQDTSGANNQLQNGQDAVALYSGTSAASFPNDTVPTLTGLLDAVQTGTSDPEDVPLNTALGISGIADEDANSNKDFDSAQRYPDGNGGAFLAGGSWAIDAATFNANNIPVELSVFSTN